VEEFNKLYPYIKNEENVIDEYYEWNGTYHTLKDGRIIREYMHDTGVSYEFIDKIPDPRSKPLSDTEEFVYGAVAGVWNFFTEDLATVLDPEATKGEKAFALAMFLPVGKPVKIIDKGSGFVSDGIKSLDKIIDSQKKSSKSNGSNILRDGSHLDKSGKLKPNAKYQAGEYDYVYETDTLGRLNQFDAQDLKLTQRNERLPHNSNTPGKKPGDHAGHLAADRFGGSPELDNLVSQSSKVNLSRYKKLENSWAKALNQGKKVSVNVKVNYKDFDPRPSSFEVTYK
ncbi:hypothetical protein CHH69_17790, partial [Terribacillus saccharophilus]|uniref:DNA/RNA non-specific endonuclease n=1 Tax=Terribacillus saccharophilus TaxID=361277 RepID=UPI000BD9201E